jgi:hypothetical protein
MLASYLVNKMKVKWHGKDETFKEIGLSEVVGIEAIRVKNYFF